MPRERQEEPWFKKRSNGVYYAFWYDAAKRCKRGESLDTRDHIEAARRFAAFLVRGARDERAGFSGVATVASILDAYDLEHVSDKKKVAAPERQRYAIANLKLFFADTALCDVDIEKSKVYAEARRKGLCGRPAIDSTIRRELGVLMAAANHAFKRKRVRSDDLPKVDLPEEGARTAAWLTKESLRIIFDKAEGDLLDFCKLAYFWASRRAAVEQMKKDQIDLQHSRADLNPIGARRTNKRRPMVPIYPEIRPVVERLMLNDGEYLFPQSASGRPRDFYHQFRDFCIAHEIVAVGAPDDVPWPHLLRHSRATHMLMDGEDPYKVAKLLGDTLETVERVYGHHSIEYLATKSTVEVA